MKTPTRFWKNKLKLWRYLRKSWIGLLTDITKSGEEVISCDQLDIPSIVDFLFGIIRSSFLFFLLKKQKNK